MRGNAAGHGWLRRAWSIPALALGSVALLVAGVVFGLHVPGAAFLDPFPDVGRLDYSAGPPGGFAPLDPTFVHDTLGTSARGRAGSGTGQGGPARPAEAAATDRGASMLAAPVEVTHAFVNDDFGRAYRIPSVPFTARTSTSGATSEPGEQHCGPLSGRSAWYSFTAPRDVGLLADTFGTDAAMSLSVYTGSKLDDLHRLPDACSSDARGNALVAFPATAGTTYYFQVDGPVGGRLVFTLQQQGVTKRASVSTSGQQGDGLSFLGIVSHDGSQVLMASGASTFDEPKAVQPCVRIGDIGKAAPCGKVATYLRDGIRRTTTNQYPSQNIAATDKGSLVFPGSMSADRRYFVFFATVQLHQPGAGDSQHSPYRFEVFRHDTRTGRNERVSVPYEGCGCQDTDGSSGRGEISADGRYVAFTSWASNLVRGDRNTVRDVFVRDMVTHITSRVDVPSDRDRELGEPNDAETSDPTASGKGENGDKGADLFSISGDGRYVVFKSSSDNLVRHDTNQVADVFVRDRVAGTTVRVNVSSSGVQADHQTKSVLGLGLHTISDDGRFVFFNSNASNLVSPPTADYRENVYRRDLRRGITTLVTLSSDGERANSDVKEDPERAAFTYLAPLLIAGGPDVGLSQLSYSATPDGRFVVFNSDATNLVPGDDDPSTDIFLRDLGTRTTTRVSVASTGRGAEAGKSCGTPSISDDARFVAFDCSAENLVPDDSNKTTDIFVRELPGARRLTGWY